MNSAKLASFNVTVIIYLLLICYNLVNLKMKSLNINRKKRLIKKINLPANERIKVKYDSRGSHLTRMVINNLYFVDQNYTSHLSSL